MRRLLCVAAAVLLCAAVARGYVEAPYTLGRTCHESTNIVLVEVTKVAAKFEQATLVQVTQARAQAVAAHGAGPATQGRAEQALNGALANFFQLSEA